MKKNSSGLLVAVLFLAGACARGSGPPVSANATIDGTVTSGAANLRVSVAGSSLSSPIDAKGSFVFVGVPPGATALHFSGTGVDATLSLGGLADGEHRHLAVSVSGSDAHEEAEQGETRFDGTVESIASPAIIVSGRTVITTSATQFERGGAAITLVDVQIGDRVEVEGTPQADRSVLARTISVEESESAADGGAAPVDDPAKVEFEGALTAIAGSQLTVDGVTVSISTTTVIENGDARADASALAVGQRLKIEGELQTDKSVAATKIEIHTASKPEDTHVTGAVAAIDTAAGTLTIGDSTVHVNGNTRFEGGDHQVNGLTDLKVGDKVDVEATVAANGALLAREIHRLDAPPLPEQVEVRGTITALDTAALTVQAKMFAVDSGTRMDSNGNTFKLSDLKLGDVVDVRGVARANGSLLATRIQREH